ncbi:hydrolase R7 like protein [Verticillium longisporum]|uniref:Hydrolase R7 like protein n=1 Tax=Verticillium longisporum TaxID=100787 RepID=A0A8I2ZNR0_VERLO|nr:hydrolase R7 like protein [Verticillium longisporum]
MRVFAFLALSYAAMAHPVKESRLPTIVFTPGAWHGPWAFDAVRKNLEGHGYPTSAATLVSVGNLDPDVGMWEDAASIRTELEGLIERGNEVVVVAHSYGGVPSSNAVKGLTVKDRVAEGKNGGVLMLVYLASFAIPAGTSLEDGVGGVYPDWWNLTDGFLSPLRPQAIFYADVEPAAATNAISRLKPQPLKTVQDKSAFEPWGQGLQVGYIFTEQDQAIAVEAQRGMASQFPAGSFTISLNTSHSPFLRYATGVGVAHSDNHPCYDYQDIGNDLKLEGQRTSQHEV